LQGTEGQHSLAFTIAPSGSLLMLIQPGNFVHIAPLVHPLNLLWTLSFYLLLPF